MKHHYLRCPTCGKLSKPENFTRIHEIGSADQQLTSEGRGAIKNVWTTGLPLKPEEKSLLMAAVKRAWELLKK